MEKKEQFSNEEVVLDGIERTQFDLEWFFKRKIRRATEFVPSFQVRFFTEKDVMEYLGVGKSTLYKWKKNGNLKPIRIYSAGNEVLYDELLVKQFQMWRKFRIKN
jgi:hypothetical protein